MKGIVIAPDMTIDVQDFTEPIHKSVGAVVGGIIEHVRPKGLKPPFCLICNDNGLELGLPINPIGIWLYGTQKHGYPVVGNIVLMKDGFVNGEPDIIGLSDEEECKLLLELSGQLVKRVSLD